MDAGVDAGVDAGRYSSVVRYRREEKFYIVVNATEKFYIVVNATELQIVCILWTYKYSTVLSV